MAPYEIPNATDFWRSTLQNCNCEPFPPVSSSTQQLNIADGHISCQIPSLQIYSHSIEPSTVIRAAWALIIAQMTNSDDVVFGMPVSRKVFNGKVDKQHDQEMNAVPFRVQLAQNNSILGLLAAVQDQAAELKPFDGLEVNQIAQISPDCLQACSFKNVLSVVFQKKPINFDQPTRQETNSQRGRAPVYPLWLDVCLSDRGATATAIFDTQVVKPWVVKGLLERLKVVLTEISLTKPDASWRDIQVLSQQDLDMIWGWNSDVPISIDRCVDEIIGESIQDRSHAPAVCAWDGDFTYYQLDELATKLALRLIGLGSSSHSFVPLCFEKSKWTTVAILAVLRAGSAFVLLDPSIPEKRLQDIVQQTKAVIILSSPKNQSLASRLAKNVVVADSGLFEDIGSHKDANALRLCDPNPSSPAYAVFTSGSTGTPKGVVISHRSMASAIYHQLPEFNLTPRSRIFDFASYSFDVAIHNTLFILAAGGCLCVPSDLDRLNDMGGSITSLQANTLEFTPTTAQLIDPEDFPAIETIVLSGEKISASDVRRWWGKARVINAYGPAECTPTSTINNRASTPEEALRIGSGVGNLAWIVNPEDHHTLMPPGSIGELLLEGPLVGLGYLGNEKKTAESFVNDPKWLLWGTMSYEGRNGRLYKTGDLAQYNEDGSLLIIGRKDDQIKFHGQRIELGEIEHHVQQYMSEAKRVVSELVSLQGEGSAAMLVAFLEMQDDKHGIVIDSEQADVGVIKVLPIALKVEHELSKRLPSYMIPKAFLCMSELPMTASGKANRRRLRELGRYISAEKLARIQTSGQAPKRQPESQIQKKIQEIWAQVLNIKLESIGVDDSFFKLGGDSITAMQVSATARSLSLNIRTADILQKKTISSLLERVEIMEFVPDSLLHNEDVDDQSAPQLSPIQRLYLEFQTQPNRCYDLSFLLRLKNAISKKSLIKALETIIERHKILRSRFRKNRRGVWEQHITNDIPGSMHFANETSKSPNMVKLTTQCRQALNIERGPLVAVALSTDVAAQKLFITIHHLVVDLVSLRVILRELEDLLTSGTIATSLTMQFGIWTKLQQKYAQRNLEPKEANLVEAPSLLAYWGLENETILPNKTIVETFSLDQSTSLALLTTCNDAFGTRPLELMISGLIYSFQYVFSDRPIPPVFCESHGREPWDERIDISTTVGWFTTIFPVHVCIDEAVDLLDVVCRTKDCIRKFSKNGWSYFTSQFADMTRADDFTSNFPVEILLNYEGIYQQLERQDALFQLIQSDDEDGSAPGHELQGFSAFDFALRVENGCLITSVAYPECIKHRSRISLWIEKFKVTLEKLAERLPEIPPKWTLSDYPLAFSSYDSICQFCRDWPTRLGIRLQDVEDIYPCSPAQEGMLIAQGKDSTCYRAWTDVEIQSIDGNALTYDKVRNTWALLVKRHTLLRALLVEDVPGSTGTMHIILKDPVLNITYIGTGCQGTMSKLESKTATYNTDGIRHHLVMQQINDTTAVLRLHIDHTIVDGFSENLLWSEFTTAYNDRLDVAPPYRKFINYLEQQTDTAGLEFWNRHLENVPPCIFPVANVEKYNSIAIDLQGIDTNHLRTFCQSSDISTATVIQVAWGLVLSKYARTETPCFGNISSGRDVPIDHVEKIFGPLISIIPCRVSLESSNSVLETLKQFQEDYISSLPYQHVYLGKIHQTLGLGNQRLFNSTISIQKGGNDTNNVTGGNGISLRTLQDSDPTEYGVVVVVTDRDINLNIRLDFRRGCISTMEAHRLSECFSTAISEIAANPTKCVGDISLVGHSDLLRMWAENSTVPPLIDGFVHQIIEDHAQNNPHAPAVCAWNGDLTYKELDRLSNRLGHLLVDAGIGPNVLVPLSFEKSMWAVVALYAVLKAGGGFVFLDTSLPEQRLQPICQQLNANLALCSPSSKEICSRLVERTITVAPELFQDQVGNDGKVHSHGSSTSSIMYVSFTSGSKGTPKGSMVSHRNLVSALHYQNRIKCISTSTRVFDFASYGLDWAIENILSALFHGACICIPSEAARKNELAKSITSLQATFVGLTPSILQSLSPEELPSIDTVFNVGEAVYANDVSRWYEQKRVVVVYGPSECTPFTAFQLISNPEEATSLGKPVGLLAWIVDPGNHDLLMPFGCVGELLLEGPLVGLGYLNDAERTENAFIEDPAWLLKGAAGHIGRHGRLYKTGDLVRYSPDGNLAFVGRKDTQVKLRGQRIELGEIEKHIQKNIPEAQQVVAEVIVPRGEGSKPILVAIIQMSNDNFDIDSLGDLKDLMLIDAHIEDKLAQHLPNYMLPTAFFRMRKLPITIRGKTDRNRLRQICASIYAQKLADLRATGYGPKQQPRSDAEKKLQEVWAKELGIGLDHIGMRDNFFNLGGNSITAMKVVAAARKVGIALTTAEIFRHPTISILAENVQVYERRNDGSDHNATIPDSLQKKLLGEIDAQKLSFNSGYVDNIFPLTWFQKDAIRDGTIYPDQFCNYFYIDMGTNLDIEKFKRSCRLTLERLPILRSCFPSILDRHWRVVLQPFDNFRLLSVEEDLDKATSNFCCKDTKEVSETEPPVAFILLKNNTQGFRLVLRIQHAQFDGFSLNIIFRALADGYKNGSISSSPDHSKFLAYAQQRRLKSMAFWKDFLRGSSITQLGPSLLPEDGEGRLPKPIVIESAISLPSLPSHLTMASLVLSAWAIVISRVTGESDIVLSHLVTARSVAMDGVQDILGPCMNAVPLRVNPWTYSKSAKLLSAVQEQVISIGEAETLGLGEIIEECTDWPGGTMFDSEIQHQSFDDSETFKFEDPSSEVEAFEVAVLPRLSIVSRPHRGRLLIEVSAHTRLMSKASATRLSRVLCETVEYLSDLNSPLDSLSDGIKLC